MGDGQGRTLFVVELGGDIQLERSGLLLRLELTSNPEILAVVRSAVGSLAASMGFPESDCRALTRAVDEALANVIRHAYGDRLGQPIELLCHRIIVRVGEKRGPALEIFLLDRGTSCTGKKFCGRPLDEIRPGGLGMHFIQNGADVVQYSRKLGKNRLRLVKFLPARESQGTSVKGDS
jgi:anti-sigma regulatory factor (Ser/Thr protein kinase)